MQAIIKGAKLPRFVGFIGAQHAGKDACSLYLRDTYDYTVFGFSDPVYDALWAINPWIQISHPDTSPPTFERLQTVVMRLGWDAAKRTYQDIREGLVRVGTEAGRDIHGQDIWVKHMDKRTISYPRVALRDVRFENEINFIRDNGGVIVWVRRPGGEQNGSGNHISEQLDRAKYADYTIWNDSSPARLHSRIEEFLDWYEGLDMQPVSIPIRSDV